MVGSVATMRVSSVMVEPSSVRGTLKSTRINNRLLVRSMSRIVSLGMVRNLSEVLGTREVGVVDHSVHLDLDTPGGIEQRGNDNQSGGGTDFAEEFAMDAAHRFPIFSVSQEHAGADDVIEGGVGLSEDVGGDGEDAACLACGILIVGAHRPGSGQVQRVSHTNRAGAAQ